MNRDEAKKMYIGMGSSDFINKIYDDFEDIQDKFTIELSGLNNVVNVLKSRTCDGCAFGGICLMEKEWKELSSANLECCDDWNKWSTPYGCNKWEDRAEE